MGRLVKIGNGASASTRRNSTSGNASGPVVASGKKGRLVRISETPKYQLGELNPKDFQDSKRESRAEPQSGTSSSANSGKRPRANSYVQGSGMSKLQQMEAQREERQQKTQNPSRSAKAAQIVREAEARSPRARSVQKADTGTLNDRGSVQRARNGYELGDVRVEDPTARDEAYRQEVKKTYGVEELPEGNGLRLAWDSLMGGLTQAGSQVVDTVDFLAGLVAPKGEKRGMDDIKYWEKWYTKPKGETWGEETANILDNAQRRAAENAAAWERERAMQSAAIGTTKLGVSADTLSQLGTEVAAALPQSVLAIMSGGTSIGAGAATAEGLAAKSSLALSAGAEKLRQMAVNGIADMAKDPNFWGSFVQTVGSDYEEALSSGADQSHAALAAVIGSFINAAVEIGGETGDAGLQELARKGDQAGIVDWVKSSLNEGKEEVIQGIVSRLTNAAVFDKDAKMFGDGGIIDPATALEEFKGGFAVGAILGGGQMLANSAIDRMNANRMEDTIGNVRQTLGAEGQSTFDQMRTEGQDPSAAVEYTERFVDAYNKGKRNERIPQAAGMTDAEAETRAAWNAGRVDALTREGARNKQNQATREAGAGVIRTEYTDSLDQKTVSALDRAAKQLGVTVAFADEVEGGKANAEIQGNRITISKVTDNPVRAVFGHEITHRIQELSADSYAEYKAAAREAMGADFDRLVGDYQRDALENGFEYSRAQAEDEVVADFAGDLLQKDGALERFIQSAQSKPTLLQRIAQVFRDLVNKLRGTEKAQAERALGKLEKAYREAAKAEKSVGEIVSKYSQKRPGENVKAATRQESLSMNATAPENVARYQSEITEVLDGTMHSNQMVLLGKPSAVLAQYMGSDNPLYMPQKSVKKAVFPKGENGGKHGLGRVVLDELLYQLEDPLAITGNTSDHAAAGDHSIVVWTDWKTEAGDSVIVPIRIDATGTVGVYNNVNTVFDAFNPEYVADLMREGNILYTKNGKSLSELIDQRRQVPKIENGNALSDTSVTETGENVKRKFSRKTTSALFNAYKDINQRLRAGEITQEQAAQEKATALDRIYTGYVQSYGEMAPGENPARKVSVPKQTSDTTKVSQTIRTIMEAKATPESILPTLKESIANGDFDYETYTDAASKADAEKTIRDVGWDKAQRKWFNAMENGIVTKENTALGWTLYNNAVNSGNTELAIDVLNQMVKSQRNAAQALQATRILKQLSPEGQLYQVQRSVADLQREINNRYRKDGAPKLEIDKDLAKKLMEAKDQTSRDKVLEEIYKDIGRQMPSRFIDKWNAWRYLAMLGNPRTHVRNIVGNAGFMPVVGAKNLTAQVIESVASKFSPGMERTKGTFSAKLFKAALADYANAEGAAMSGGKYSDYAAANKYVEEGRQIFGTSRWKFWNKTGGRALETLRKKNSAALDTEDVWFSKPHYANAMAQYCKANGITAEQIRSGDEKVLRKARAYAVQEAAKATYRDTNALSEAVSSIGGRWRSSDNKVKRVTGTLVEGILPFRKTPANILARGLEYSPAGLLKGLTNDLVQVKKGNMTAAQAIDNISAGLTGTGLLILGGYMAAEGLLGAFLRGGGSGDDDKDKMDDLAGRQDYSLEVGDTSVTLDWLAPEALPLFVGVNLYETWKANNGEMQLSDYLNAIKNVSEPMVEMSCLQSLDDVFNSVATARYSGKSALTSVLVSAATSYITQALPTILGQAERTSEPLRMTTYTSKGKFATTDVQYFLGKSSARIPGLDYQQIPYIDAWGRTENNGTAGQRAANNFLNPAYVSTIRQSDMEKEIERLYEATEDGGVVPDRADKSIKLQEGTKYLSAEEYVKYATEKGQKSYALAEELVNSAAYQAADDTRKADMIRYAYQYATAVAKTKVSDYALRGWQAKCAEVTKKTGLSEATYITLYLEQLDVEGYKDKDGDAIANSAGLQKMEVVYNMPGLTDAQRSALFGAFGVGKKVAHYNKAKVSQELGKLRSKAR